MATSTSATTQLVRFGVFELDMQAGELRRNGAKVRLEGQPLTILALLIERRGEVVTREELKEKLWPADTFVDFEHSINVAVKRLREALQDSATSPRFIETLPRRGYRFICPLNGGAAEPASAFEKRFHRLALVAISVLAVLMAVAITNVAGMRDRLLGRPTTGTIKRIAVLPLRPQSSDPADAYLAEGFTEMFITELGTLGTPEVVSHQTVLQYTGSNKPLPEIARELNVDAVIEGTILRVGERVRVTVNVVVFNPERHLIAEPFEGDLRDVFGVQRNVARAIAEKIRVRVPANQAKRPNPRPVSPEVAEAILRGFAYFKKGTEQDRTKAAEWFSKAVELDPQCALGYAYLAVLYSHGGAVRQGGYRETLALSRQWAEKALQLDDTVPQAHTALGWIKLSEWDFQGADREFKRAIELNPNFMEARTWYAQYLATIGRKDEAIAEAAFVLQLDPVSSSNVVHAAWALMATGKVDEAIGRFRAVAELDPSYPWSHLFLGECYLRKNMPQEGLAELRLAAEVSHPDVRADGMLAYAYARTGQRAEAERILRDLEARLRQRSAEGKRLPINVMVPAYLAVGEKEKAFDYLQAAYERRGGGGLAFMGIDEAFRPLFPEPRFQDLLRQVGLPAVQ